MRRELRNYFQLLIVTQCLWTFAECSQKEETIPQFFDDTINVVTLAGGLGVILLCIILAVIVVKVKGRKKGQSVIQEAISASKLG